MELFLNSIPQDQKDFLNLLDLTAKVHLYSKELKMIDYHLLLGETFYQLDKSQLWNSLDSDKRTKILRTMTENILREAYFIESAGMAYAAKMNLTSVTKEERQFFCFVAEEEAKHLRLVESLFDFDKSRNNIPSFALLIGEIIQEASRKSHLLLIQILLEGWGLNYYKNLAKESHYERVTSVFKLILKDEIRHHSAGVILFSKDWNSTDQKPENVNELSSYIHRICKMIQIGPFALCQEVFKQINAPNSEKVIKFLNDIDAVRTTSLKMKLVEDLISKSLSHDYINEMRNNNCFEALNLEKMAEALVGSMPEIFQHQRND
jgi:rubrerythrin